MENRVSDQLAVNGLPRQTGAAGRREQVPPWWPRAGTEPSEGRKSDRELRLFALVVSAPLALIAGYLAWKGTVAVGLVLGGASVVLLAVAVALPRALAPVERMWMKLALAMSVVLTYVVLTLTYFLVITPVGFLVRSFGRGGLALRFEPERTSYWEPVEEDGPATRPDRPY